MFFLLHLAPGGPETFLLGEGAPQEDILRIRRTLNLDKSPLEQYFDFLGRLTRFSVGTSLFNGEPVSQRIALYLPNTIYLAIAAMILAILFSFPAGVWAAFRENSAVDISITLVSAFGFALPNFFLATLLVLVFAVRLPWLPVSGDEGFRYIIMPSLTLALSMSALLTRIIKTSVAAELKKPYVLLARAKGLSPVRVFRSHVLRNAAIPIVTTLGIQMSALLTGTVITETIFSWQGIGYLLITSIRQRDYPVIQGVILFIAAVYLTLNFLVDLSYLFIDPRIRHGLKKHAFK